MRAADLQRLVDALRPPIHTFVNESRVRVALLVNGAGQVLAQHGFSRGVEIMNVASLAAAAHASSQALAQLTGAERWTHLYHAGRERQLFLAPLATPAGEFILVAIFDNSSSLGIVTLFFEDLEAEVAALPELRTVRPAADQASFERDLQASLDVTSAEPLPED